MPAAKKKAAKPAPVSPNAQLLKNIEQLVALSAEAKLRDKAVDELKAWFREQSGGENRDFTDGSHVVSVRWKERAGGWDGEKLETVISVPENFKKAPTQYQEVSCRKAKAGAA